MRTLGIAHAVVTSVNRDELPDGGAAHFAATIRAIRALAPGVTVEVLIPDFLGSAAALKAVLDELLPDERIALHGAIASALTALALVIAALPFTSLAGTFTSDFTKGVDTNYWGIWTANAYPDGW